MAPPHGDPDSPTAANAGTGARSQYDQLLIVLGELREKIVDAYAATARGRRGGGE